MIDFHKMTAKSFDPIVGTQATIVSLDAEVRVELLEVKQLGSGEREGGAFSLLWQGPTAPALPQATYRIAHELIGEQDVFLVPVANKTAGIQYEAIFT